MRNIIDQICKSYEINITEKYVHVSNYIKILDISFNSINILLYNKQINIRGDKLIINRLDRNELLVSGNIKGIDFIEN